MSIAVTAAPVDLEPFVWLIVILIALVVLGLIVYFLWGALSSWLSGLWASLSSWWNTTGAPAVAAPGEALSGLTPQNTVGDPDYVPTGQAGLGDNGNVWPSDF